MEAPTDSHPSPKNLRQSGFNPRIHVPERRVPSLGRPRTPIPERNAADLFDTHTIWACDQRPKPAQILLQVQRNLGLVENDTRVSWHAILLQVRRELGKRRAEVFPQIRPVDQYSSVMTSAVTAMIRTSDSPSSWKNSWSAPLRSRLIRWVARSTEYDGNS